MNVTMLAKVHKRVPLNNLRRATSSSSPLVLVPGLAAISAGIFHLPCTVHELCGTLELPEPRRTEIKPDKQSKPALKSCCKEAHYLYTWAQRLEAHGDPQGKNCNK